MANLKEEVAPWDMEYASPPTEEEKAPWDEDFGNDNDPLAATSEAPQMTQAPPPVAKTPTAEDPFSGSMLGLDSVFTSQNPEMQQPTRSEYKDNSGMQPAGGFAPPKSIEEALDENGDISSTVYDDMNYEDAVNFYQKIMNDPNAQLVSSVTGRVGQAVGLTDRAAPDTLVYKGHKVPFPEPSFFGRDQKGSGQSVPTKIMEGLEDAAGNAAQVALTVPSLVTGVNLQGLAERPEVKSGDFTDAMLHEAPSALIGGFGGMGVANKALGAAGGVAERLLPKALTTAEKGFPGLVRATGEYAGSIGSAATRMVGAEGGSTLGMDEDASGILAGPNGLANESSYAPFFATNLPDQSDAEKTLYKKINLMTDSFITGSAAGIVGRTFAKGLGMIKDTYIKGALPSISKGAEEKVVNEAVLHSLRPDLINAAPSDKAAAAEEISKLIDIGQSEFKVLKDQGKNGDIVELDPFAAIVLGARKAGNKELAFNAEKFRDRVLAADMEQTGTKQRSYESDVIEPFKQGVYDAGGGAQGVEASRGAIVRSGQEDVGTALSRTKEAGLAADQGIEDYADRIRTDLNFGQIVSDLEKDTGIDINRSTRQSNQEVATQARSAFDKISEERRKLYQAIPDNVQVKFEGDDGLANVLFKQAEDGSTGETFVDGLTPQMREIISSSNGSFKKLHNELVPMLSKAISKGAPGDFKVDNLRAIKDNILDTQIDLLDDDAAKSVSAARDYNQKSYMRYFGKGAPLESISKPATKGGGLQRINEGNAQEANRAVRKNLQGQVISGDDNLERGQDLVDVLSRPDVKGDPNVVLRDSLTEAGNSFRGKVQGKGVASLRREDIVQSLKDRAGLIGSKFPKELSEINKLADDMVSGEKTMADLEARYGVVADEGKELVGKVKSEQADFFNPDGSAKTSGQPIFSKLFKNKEDDQGLNSAINRASQTGQLKGMQAAFGKELQEVSPKDFGKVDDPENHILKVANKLFADTPEVVDGIKEAYKLADVTKPGQTSGNISSIGAGADKDYKATVNKVVTLMFGVLNPTATRVRNFTSVMADKTAPSDGLKRTLDMIASDPKEFQAMLKKYNKKDFFTPGNKRLLTEFMSRASLRSGPLTDKERAYVNEEWEKYQTNEALGGAEGKVPEYDLEKAQD